MGCTLWREDVSLISSAFFSCSEPLRTHNHTLLSHWWLSVSVGPCLPIYISKEQGGPVTFPATGHWFSQKSKSKLVYDWRSIGQSVLVSGDRLRPVFNFYFSSVETFFRCLPFLVGTLSDERICLQFIRTVLLGLASAVTLGSKSPGTRDPILLFRLRLSSLSVASYDSQGYGGGMLTHFAPSTVPLDSGVTLYTSGMDGVENLRGCLPTLLSDGTETATCLRSFCPTIPVSLSQYYPFCSLQVKAFHQADPLIKMSC
jgi:hypothetical protein